MQENSPAIDQGSSSDAPGDDFEGNFRPYGNGYDIGALEYGSERASTTTTVSVTTTTTTTSAPCLAENIYGENEAKTVIIRWFRDTVLSKTPEGQQIIRLYYQWSPIIVKAMENDEEFKSELKEIIDGVLGLIGDAE